GSGREIRVGIVLIACYGGLLCDGDEHVFERELKLCDLALDLLGGLAEGLLLQPGDLQAEGLDDQVMGAQRGRQLRVLGLQRSDHRLEEGGIFGKIGGRVQHGLCYGEMAEKSRKTATFQKEKSPCACWRRAPVGAPPIDPFPQHRELGRRQPGRSVGCRRPGKTAALENLVIKAKPLAVPVKQLQPVAAPDPKGEYGTARGLLAQHRLGQQGEARNPYAHISNDAGEVLPQTSSWPDQAAS